MHSALHILLTEDDLFDGRGLMLGDCMRWLKVRIKLYERFFTRNGVADLKPESENKSRKNLLFSLFDWITSDR